MNLSGSEFIFIGLKEGLEVSFVLYLLRGYLQRFHKRASWILLSVVFALFLALLGSIISAVLNPPGYQGFIDKSAGYSFGVFYLFSLVLFYQHTGTELFGAVKRYIVTVSVASIIAVLFTLLYFLPDFSATALYLKDAIRLAEGYIPLVFVFTGLISGLLVFYLILRLLGSALLDRFTAIFDLPQLFLFLTLLKLLTGGMKGSGNLSLVGAVQSGLIKLVHDVVHQTFITVMVPDHMLLSVTAWNFIGYLFSINVAQYLALFVLFFPLFVMLRLYINAPIDIPKTLTVKAHVRKYVKSVKNRRFLKSLPVMFFLVLILFVWFSEREKNTGRLYNPKPQPVVVEAGEVKIPISSPGADLRDGMLHKFVIDINGDVVRILVMKKTDQGLAVCLDACEICPPEGYAQGDNYVVCLYCRTPIPVDSLGKPGGCNPIPLDAVITDKEIRIKLSEIENKWLLVKAKKTKVIK